MQYKQVVRIMMEIVKTPDVPTEVLLAVTRAFCRLDIPPKLGPYPKRSIPQVLWRIASDSTGNPEVRWRTLRRLLKATPKPSPAGANA